MMDQQTFDHAMVQWRKDRQAAMNGFNRAVADLKHAKDVKVRQLREDIETVQCEYQDAVYDISTRHSPRSAEGCREIAYAKRERDMEIKRINAEIHQIEDDCWEKTQTLRKNKDTYKYTADERKAQIIAEYSAWLQQMKAAKLGQTLSDDTNNNNQPI